MLTYFFLMQIFGIRSLENVLFSHKIIYKATSTSLKTIIYKAILAMET